MWDFKIRRPSTEARTETGGFIGQQKGKKRMTTRCWHRPNLRSPSASQEEGRRIGSSRTDEVIERIPGEVSMLLLR